MFRSCSSFRKRREIALQLSRGQGLNQYCFPHNRTESQVSWGQILGTLTSVILRTKEQSLNLWPHCSWAPLLCKMYIRKLSKKLPRQKELHYSAVLLLLFRHRVSTQLGKILDPRFI